MRLTLLPSFLSAAVLAACGGNSFEENTRSLNGQVDFSSGCSAAQEAKIRQAFDIARNQVFDAPWNMRDCLQNTVISGERYPWAEEIVAQLGQNMPTEVSCEDLGDNAGWARIGIDDESIELDRGFVDSYQPDVIAATVLHEVSHNKGYDHQDITDTNGAGISYDYNLAVPNQVDSCSKSISNGDTPPVGGFDALKDAPERAELGPVGGAGGTSFETECAEQRWVYGIGVRTGSRLDALTLRCRSAAGSSASSLPARGGTGGTAATQDCASGEVAIGFSGTAGSTLNSLGVICSPVSAVRNRSLSFMSIRNPIGSSSGHHFYRVCPAGMALKGTFGRAGAAIDRLRPLCHQIDLLDFTVDRFLPRVGGTGGSNAYIEQYECPGRMAFKDLDGLFSPSGSVDRANPTCTSLLLTSDFRNRSYWHRLGGGYERPLPSVGGWMGSWGYSSCPTGQVVMGLHGTASDRLNSLGPVATVTSWSQTSGVSVPAYGTAQGNGSVGSWFDVRCNRGEFIAGWRMRSGQWTNTAVTYVEPICRSFRVPPPIIIIANP